MIFGFSSIRFDSCVLFFKSNGMTRCRVGNRSRVYDAVVETTFIDEDWSGVGVVELIRCRYSLILKRGRFFGSNLCVPFTRIALVALLN